MGADGLWIKTVAVVLVTFFISKIILDRVLFELIPEPISLDLLGSFSSGLEIARAVASLIASIVIALYFGYSFYSARSHES